GYIRSDVIEVRILANPVGGSVGSNTASGQQNTENNADTPFSSEPRGHIWLGFHLFEIVC
ncbi:MAG: hypothetical protein NZ932_05455, partial [Candidatus Bathyarchaeota archaeon]|nr:hypothetical protein [Candidatus Bathyarchaeota archaeon]